jgi:hypothetical protein
MKIDRVLCDTDETDAYFEYIEEVWKDVPSGLIYDLDESGFQDLLDARCTIVLVPADFPENSIPIPVKRNGRIRISSGFNRQTVQILKILGGYHKATIPYNVISSFRKVGICSCYSEEHSCTVAYVEKEAATNVRHWHTSKKRINIGEAQEIEKKTNKLRKL